MARGAQGGDKQSGDWTTTVRSGASGEGRGGMEEQRRWHTNEELTDGEVGDMGDLRTPLRSPPRLRGGKGRRKFPRVE